MFPLAVCDLACDPIVAAEVIAVVYLPPVFTMETCRRAHLYAHTVTLHTHSCTHIHTTACADVHAHTFCGPKAFGCLATAERKFHLQKEDFTSSLTTPKITKAVQTHQAASTLTHTRTDTHKHTHMHTHTHLVWLKNPGLTVLRPLF